MSDTSHVKNIPPQLRTLEQIRDELQHKRDQLVSDMIAASSTRHGGSGHPRSVQIDSPAIGAAWLTWGHPYVIDADYVLPKLGWLFSELGLHGVPNLPQWTGEPQTENEALRCLNTLLACCDGALPTRDKQHAGGASNDGPSYTPPWEGDDWDELEPQVRQLLLYMHGREKADLCELCPHVWGKEYLTDNGVTEAARETATSKANKFLGKRQWPRSLAKVRKEPYLRWE